MRKEKHLFSPSLLLVGWTVCFFKRSAR